MGGFEYRKGDGMVGSFRSSTPIAIQKISMRKNSEKEYNDWFYLHGRRNQRNRKVKQVRETTVICEMPGSNEQATKE